MIQALFLGGLYIYGYWVSLAFPGDWEPRIRAAGAFFIGVVCWAVFGILLLFLGLPYSAPSMAGLAGLGAIIAGTRSRRRLGKSPGAFAAGLCALLILAGIFSYWNLSMLGDDSFFLLTIGRMIGTAHGLPPVVREQLSAWGILAPLVHSASPWLGVDYLWAFTPTLAASFWVFFALVSAYVLRSAAPELTSGKRRLLVAAAVATVLGSTFGLFETIFIHNNLTAGAFYFLFLSSAFLYLREGGPWIAAAWFGLVGFFLSRNEAAGMAAPAVLLFLSDTSFDREGRSRERLAFLVAFVTVAGAWYFTQLHSIGSGQSYLGPARIAVMFLPYCGLLLVYLIAPVLSLPARILSVSRKWLLPLVAILAGVMVSLDLHAMGVSLNAVLMNIFFVGLWGMIWMVALPVFLLSAFQERTDKDHLLRHGILFFLMAWFVMPFRQGTYRAGWGDSGNRNLTHILPALLLFLMLAYATEPVAKAD